jgi:hypothetical protein
MAEIVHEDGDIRLVRIDQHYYSGDDQLIQMFARFSDRAVVISQCYLVSGKPKSFMLTSQQMETFCNAWISYTNDQREKAEAEQQRQIEVLDKAYALAESCKAVQVEKHDQSSPWSVTMPDFGWGNVEPIYTPDQFLHIVKEAIEYCRPIQEAYKLASEYPAIHIEQDRPNCAIWWVFIEDEYGSYAHQDDIVSIVQQAIDKYVEHQNKLTKENN